MAHTNKQTWMAVLFAGMLATPQQSPTHTPTRRQLHGLAAPHLIRLPTTGTVDRHHDWTGGTGSWVTQQMALVFASRFRVYGQLF